MTSKLREVLGLPELNGRPVVPPSELGPAFRSGLAGLNQDMQVLAALGNQGEHQNLDSNRQNLIAAYQQVSALGDPTKNQQVIAAVAKVQETASAKAASATAAREEWWKREADFDKALVKIGELEDVGHPEAASFRKFTDELLKRANEGQYKPANSGFDKFQTKLNDAHSLYLTDGPSGEETEGGGGSDRSNGSAGDVDRKGTKVRAREVKGVSEAKTKSKKAADGPPKWNANWTKALPDFNRIMRREPPDTRRQQIREQLKQAATRMWQAIDESSDLNAAHKHSEQVVKLVGQFNEATTKLYRVDDPASRYRFEIGDFERRFSGAIKEFPPVGTEMIDAVKKMQSLKTEMQNKALGGDFKQAVKDLDHLEDLLYDYKSGPEMEKHVKEARLKNPVKYEYTDALFQLEDKLDQALAKRSKNDGIIRLQNEIKALKGEMEKAEAKGDYSLALTRVKSLALLVEKFNRTRDCQWVTKKAGLLHALIHKHYLRAGEHLDEASKAYDRAMKKHKATIREDTAMKDFLIDIFFVALGGGLGGAAAAGIKNALVKAFDKAVADLKKSGALIDARKDIIKFGVRTLPKVAGSSKDDDSLDLKVGNVELGDNGVDLGRNFGIALKKEGQALLDKVIDPLRSIQEIECDFDTVEIDVDPVAALESDPFAKLLGAIKQPSDTVFAELIWEAWIKKEMDGHVYKSSLSAPLIKPGIIDDIFDQTGNSKLIVELVEKANKNPYGPQKPTGGQVHGVYGNKF